ncbi:hypothetical protein PIB30_092350 [Stylosanthes scabra]|uniref:Putative plant transposon protein domain-containing protein n=1 Tax=Stylosanthes scabra TaxID=79078 RepID=A0ABU6VUQ0_9FABA|nr:hypothetical protein [Stylosanthes scabra]
MAGSSSSNVYDEHRFLAFFNQSVFEKYARHKDIIVERCFNLEDDEYPEIGNHISLRGWRRLASPGDKIKVLMIQEFFANAARTKEEIDAAEEHPLTSYVRGVEIDFSPANIKRVMRMKDNTPEAETNFDTRQQSNPMLDKVIHDLCVPGATWKFGTRQPPQPIQLRRRELLPLTRGWLEFIKHNIHPSSNKSEVTVQNAILIHSIVKGEDVRVEELISAKIALMAQNLQLKGKLGFPSLIYKLCKDAQVPFREYRRTPYIETTKPITAKVMETIRGGDLPAPRRHQGAGHDDDQDQEMPQYEPNQEDEDEDRDDHEAHHEQPQQYNYFDFQGLQQQQQNGFQAIAGTLTNMQIETFNYLERMKTQQEAQSDQMKTIIAQQEELISEQNRQLQAMRRNQEQMERDIREIRKTQINPSMNGSKEELDRLRKIIEDQRIALVQQNRSMVGKSQVPVMEGSSHQKLEEIATTVLQHKEELKNIRAQMRKWTKHSSARECYDCWAHQQANPNLVPMPVYKITKLVLDNLDNNRPMFHGALKSDLEAGQSSTEPAPSQKPDNHIDEYFEK